MKMIATSLFAGIALLLSVSGHSAPRILEINSNFSKAIYSEALKSGIRFDSTLCRDSTADCWLIDEDEVPKLSGLIHELTGRCGGFIDVTNETFERSKVFGDGYDSIIGKRPYSLPSLSRRDFRIANILDIISGQRLSKFAIAYSKALPTRYAKSAAGVEAPEWLRKTWSKIVQKRPEIKVELLPAPQDFKQQNVRVIIPGTDPAAPIVVLGAHLDSINSKGMFNRGKGSAPGADDDGSGIGALTELLFAIAESGFQPKASVHLIGYAAEELGLLGSIEVAQNYAKAKTKIRGVMNLDMIAYPGANGDIVFMTDYTSRELTTWTEQLLGTYHIGNFREDECGYACSDHASWDRYGFPAVMPFEATMHTMNPRIHSEEDLWDTQLDIAHAERIAKLAAAFVLELAK